MKGVKSVPLLRKLRDSCLVTAKRRKVRKAEYFIVSDAQIV